MTNPQTKAGALVRSMTVAELFTHLTDVQLKALIEGFDEQVRDMGRMFPETTADLQTLAEASRQALKSLTGEEV